MFTEKKYIKQITNLFLATATSIVLSACDTSVENSSNDINNIKTPDKAQQDSTDAFGLIVDDGYLLVRTNCVSCHSLNLVTQNRATREGWENMIRWMQKEQKLWDLGVNEDIILDYLAKNYAPKNPGRRSPIEQEEWYELK